MVRIIQYYNGIYEIGVDIGRGMFNQTKAHGIGPVFERGV